MINRLLGNLSDSSFEMRDFDENSKKIEQIKVKYMGGDSYNFNNAQNYIFGKYTKELCKNRVYLKNLYKNKKPFGIFLRDKLIDERRGDITLKIVAIIFVLFFTYFLYGAGILREIQHIIVFLVISIPISQIPFYLTKIDPEKVIEYELYNYFMTKGMKTGQWIIIYLSNSKRKNTYIDKQKKLLESSNNDSNNGVLDYLDDI